SLREGAGYILGWLIGIFLILVFSTLFPYAPPPATNPTPTVVQPLTFGELILPSILGFVLGFGALLIVRFGGYSDSRIQRALTVAALMSFTLIAGYLILRTNIADRMTVAIFVLTFGIGALVNFIFSRSVCGSFISRTEQ